MNQSQQIIGELRDVQGFPELSMFKNPTKEEMIDLVPPGARGFILPSGDVFLANVANVLQGLHTKLIQRTGGIYPEHKKAIKALEKQQLKKFDVGSDNEFGFDIRRLKGTNSFVLGDTEGWAIGDGSLPKGKRPAVVNLKKHFKAAKRKMPHIRFQVPSFFAGIK